MKVYLSVKKLDHQKKLAFLQELDQLGWGMPTSCEVIEEFEGGLAWKCNDEIDPLHAQMWCYTVPNDDEDCQGNVALIGASQVERMAGCV